MQVGAPITLEPGPNSISFFLSNSTSDRASHNTTSGGHAQDLRIHPRAAKLAAYRITRRVVWPLRVCQPHRARHSANNKSSWSDSRHGSKAMLPVAMFVVLL
jgi:hypothetical protein